MPDPECSEETGCSERRHNCIDGYPERTHIIRNVRAISGKSDYKVLLYAISRFALKNVNDRTKYVIFTSDRTFWRSAQHQHKSLNGNAHPDVKFTVDNRVRANVTVGRRTRNIGIRIEYIPRPKSKDPTRNRTRSGRPTKAQKRLILRRMVDRAEDILFGTSS